ncbi:unnamed protein product, partial [Rotaria sp. Silwood1]
MHLLYEICIESIKGRQQTYFLKHYDWNKAPDRD